MPLSRMSIIRTAENVCHASERAEQIVRASKTKPAKLLAVFVVDTNETELTIPFAN